MSFWCCKFVRDNFIVGLLGRSYDFVVVVCRRI